VFPRIHAQPTQAGTLRVRLEQLRARGSILNLGQAVGVVVPLCTELVSLHAAGRRLFVHPSSVVEDEYGFYHLAPQFASIPPTAPRDLACLAPELRTGHAGDARASVYAIGAMLYELVTGESVGPGMRRPSDAVTGLPPELEVILAKALIADPAHRPDDLGALAQALYNMSPTGSIRPPPADTSHLDHAGNMDVDVSLSMLPPAPSQRIPVVHAVARGDKTAQLAELKMRLEADRRPRYVVVKDGMDHGPFSAVELLQQIASHAFSEDDGVRDALSRQERPIRDWPEFAPFAEQAKIHRDIRAEKDAIDRVVVQESRSTRSKALLGLALVGALLCVAGLWYLTARGRKSDEIAVQKETLTNVEADAGLAVPKRKGGGSRGVVGRSGKYPILGGGMSCESARAAYVEEMNVGGPRGQADITAGQYGSILNRGSYFGGCGVPDSMGLNICAAVQNGRAVGVTVRTTPRNPRIEGCIAGGVRRLSFPSHPKLDVTRTTF
jgi:hypothetical protein